MPYASGTIKVRVNGTMPFGERFSWGYQLMAAGAPTQLNVDAAVAGTSRGLGVTGGTGPLDLMDPATAVVSIEAYGYDGGAEASVQSVDNTRLVGRGTAPGLPNQMAWCVSLLTGQPGRSFRGRLYLPLSGFPILGQPATASCTALATNIANMLMQSEGSGSGQPLRAVVASLKRGVSTPITKVFVDSRFDVQRTRAQSSTITTSGNHAVT